MTKKEFLEQLLKTTNDNELVAYYDELISDRIEAGEDEIQVINSLDVKKILKTQEFQTAKRELEQTSKTKGRWKFWVVFIILLCNPITFPIALGLLIATIILFAVSFGLFAGALAGLGFGLYSTTMMIIQSEPAGAILVTLGATLITAGILGTIGFGFLVILTKFYKWLLVKLFKKSKKEKTGGKQ